MNNTIQKNQKTKKQKNKFGSLGFWHFSHWGFSMIELMVAISIIAVLSVASIIGFGYLNDILRIRQVTGTIDDLVKKEELKVLRGDYDKATIYFLPDFLVIDEEEKGDDPDFMELGNPCGKGYILKYNNGGDLIQKDESDRVIDAKRVVGGNSECIEFRNSQDNEWSFQMSDSGISSDIMKFVQFNLQRDYLNNPGSIGDGAGSKLIIEGPYSKKTFYDGNTKVPSLSLSVNDLNGNSSDTLIIN